MTIDPRFEGVTLHVGWGLWNVAGALVPYLDAAAHPTSLVEEVLRQSHLRPMWKPGEQRWLNIACNSPLLADAFPADRVRVWSKSGKSRLLSEHPEVAQWSGVMTSGDMWTFFGEAWVDEVQP